MLSASCKKRGDSVGKQFARIGGVSIGGNTLSLKKKLRGTSIIERRYLLLLWKEGLPSAAEGRTRVFPPGGGGGEGASSGPWECSSSLFLKEGPSAEGNVRREAGNFS